MLLAHSCASCNILCSGNHLLLRFTQNGLFLRTARNVVPKLAQHVVHILYLRARDFGLAAQVPLFIQVCGVVEEHTFCPFLAVPEYLIPSSPSSLLVVGFRCSRNIEMNNEAKASNVNAHTKGIRRDHNVKPFVVITLKALKYLLFHFWLQTCMVYIDMKARDALAQFLSNSLSCLFISTIYYSSLSFSSFSVPMLAQSCRSLLTKELY